MNENEFSTHLLLFIVCYQLNVMHIIETKMSNKSDLSLLTVSSDLNIAYRSNKQRTNKLSREASPDVQR